MSDDRVLAALTRLEAGQGGLGERLDRIDQRLDRTDQRLDRMDQRLDSLAGTVLTLRVELSERMDRQQNALTDIRNDIGVNFGATDRVREANDSTRGELRALGEMVTAMHRQITTLASRVREITGDP